mmetsp:Transcript_39438/g.98720  ORF Transcript_39438/g.98720 Transcript_39438/m.98720 type:complete len:85 (-) Transcript_39438:82-336(-)
MGEEREKGQCCCGRGNRIPGLSGNLLPRSFTDNSCCLAGSMRKASTVEESMLTSKDDSARVMAVLHIGRVMDGHRCEGRLLRSD